jgi:hypothetical protein
MSEGFKPRTDILPEPQQRLWPQLSALSKLGFVLYGGTAVALRLGHRRSVDFDFFSERPLDRDALHAQFPAIAEATFLQDRPDALSVLLPVEPSDHVKVSFFGAIDFGRTGVPEITNDGVLQIASLDDLMATKVKVILQRVESKDYRDIAAMVSAGVSLARGLAAAQKMYGPNFQPSESLKAMAYFQGGDLSTLTREEKSCLIKAVSEVRDLPEVAVLSQQLSTS